MVAKFDFRPERIINPPKPKTRKAFMLILSLFIAFAVFAGYASFMAAVESLSLQSSVFSLQDRADKLEGVRIGLVAEMGRLQKREEAYKLTLAVMNQELPAIEILNAIDRSIPEGITLSGITINAGSVSLSGTANTEEKIVQATRALLDSGVFKVAQVPVANRTANRGVINFSLLLTPLVLSEVKR